MHDRPRQERRNRPAQQPLLGQAANLLGRRQGERQLGNRLIAEGHPGLQRVGHAGPVRLHEQVVHEVDPKIQVLKARQRLGSVGLLVTSPVQIEGIRDAVPPTRHELGAGIGGEDLLPGVMPLHRGEMRAAHEPLRLVVEAGLGGGAGQPLDHSPQRPSRGRQARGELIRYVRVVAAEQLIAPLPGQRDLDRAGGELRDQVGGQRRRIGERLVEHLDQARQELDRVRANHQLVVIGAVTLGDHARR